MLQIAGYLVSYSDARAIMGKLQIPDKGVDNIRLQFPLNDWLAKTKRYNIVCTTVGDVYSCYMDAEGVFLMTHIKNVRRRESQDGETLVERDKDRYVKAWLVEEGGVNGDNLQWMSFPDGDELNFLPFGARPTRNMICGPWVHYELTPAQGERAVRSKMPVSEWIDQAEASGEEVNRVWPPREDSSHP